MFIVVDTYDGCWMRDVTCPIPHAEALEFIRRNAKHYWFNKGKGRLDLIDADTRRFVSYVL